jgi:hypothetical protein
MIIGEWIAIVLFILLAMAILGKWVWIIVLLVMIYILIRWVADIYWWYKDEHQ